MPKKLYEVLEVPEDASTSAIQQAYREKVKESHPDLSDDPDAGEKFQLVLQAKEVLTDEEERELYDDLGHKTYMDMFGDDLDDGGSSSGDSDSRSTSASASSSGGSSTASRSSSTDDSSSSASTSSQRSSTSSGSTSSGSSSGTATSGQSGAETSAGSASASGSASSSSSGSSSTASDGTTSSTSGRRSGSSSAESSGGGSTRRATGGVSQRTVEREAERTRKEWQAETRSGESSGGGPWSAAGSQGDHLAAERVRTGIATKIRAQDVAEMAVVMLVVYPIFVGATVWGGFHPAVRAIVGLVTVGVVVYSLTEPVVALVAFGVWSVLTPLLMLFAGVELLSLPGLFALTVTWVPFMLAILLTLAMPDA